MKHTIRRIYIAGPMSGYKDHNFPAFNAEAKRLRALGYIVINPAEINGHLHGQLPYIEYLRRDVAQLATCDTIGFLPGWQGSRGANIEHDVSLKLELWMVMAASIVSKYEGDPIWFDDIEPVPVGIIGKALKWSRTQLANLTN